MRSSMIVLVRRAPGRAWIWESRGSRGSRHEGRSGGQESGEVGTAVPEEIDVELRGAGLEEAPRALAHVRGQAHQVEAAEIVRARLAEVGAEEGPLLLLVEAVIDGEVSEI